MDPVVPDISSVVLLLGGIIRIAVTRLDGAPARKISQLLVSAVNFVEVRTA